MAFTRAEFDAACNDHHLFAEQMHQRDGAVYPILLLLCGDLQVEVIALIEGIPGPDGTAALRARAAATGAVAAVYAGGAWIQAPGAAPAPFVGSGPQPEPCPDAESELLEGVVTTGVWPAGQATVHLLSLIDRAAVGGPRLGPDHELTDPEEGTSRWLESLLASAATPT
jgi:hypothetical protein